MIGRLISGRYRLIAPLGDGGMATIWRAVDEQLDREVAVKLLRPQFSADPGFTARFKQEARSAGGLSHPNIVGVYDYGTDGADGDQYIVMELIEGNDLSTILRDRGSLATMDAVRLGRASAGRDILIKIEGSYHGHHDTVMYSITPSMDSSGPDERPWSVPPSWPETMWSSRVPLGSCCSRTCSGVRSKAVASASLTASHVICWS